MFTKNWYKIVAAEMNRSLPKITTAYGSTANLSSRNFCLTNNATYYPYMGRISVASIPTYNDCGVIIGSGTTPPTIDDIWLEERIISPISVSVSFSHVANGDSNSITANYTITNNGTDAITISEIGICGAHSSTTALASLHLLERTLLDDPVTIEAGGVGQLTYTVKCVFPTA